MEAVSLNLSFLSNLLNNLTWTDLTNFKMIFFSIIIESLPFILIGVFVSAVLNNFFSEELLKKLLPKNKFLGIFIASILGIVFPLCECGMVPIARRLVQKGVPIYIAATFMFSTPIINPVVVAATSLAFNTNPKIVWIRLGIAFLVSVTIGIIVSVVFTETQLKSDSILHDSCCGLSHQSSSGFVTLFFVLNDTCNEFFEMGKFLIAGAVLSALAQTIIPHSLLASIGQAPFLSIITMMIFAFFISVCSSADAFIAASLGTNFTTGSLIAFMVFGPMIDLKNTFMLYHFFRRPFVLVLILTTALLCCSFSYILNLLQGGI